MEILGLLFVSCIFLSGVTGQGTNLRLKVDGIRLANGNQSAGRVEVLVGGVWGTVCDDQWDNLDAGVVCKQLNYTNGGIGLRNAAFGPGTGPIFIDDTNCDGSEDRIQDCQMKARFNNVDVGCNHIEDASVICDTSGAFTNAVMATTTTPPRTAAPVPDNCAPGTSNRVRLVSNNNNPGEGRLEVLNPNTNTWGSVCDDFFNENTAKVVCRMLCYTDSQWARAGAREEVLGPPRFPIILDDVICVGNENAIQDCRHAPWGLTNCAQTEAAAITCINLDSAPPEVPSPVLECRDGYLIAAFAKARDPELEEKHLTIANPMTPGVPCNVQTSGDNTNDTVVVIRIPFYGCGTEVSNNATHLIYSNVIKYDYTRTQGLITRVNTYRVIVSCEMPRDSQVTRPVEPQTQVVTQRATGKFVVTMTFYRNNSFDEPVTQTPLRMPLGEWLNVALQLESVDSRLKLIVPTCVATPDGDINNTINYPLFLNKCPTEPSIGFFSLNQTRFGYRYKLFKFVGDSMNSVYLHCGAFVCLMEETSAQCDRSCNPAKPTDTPTSGRRKREASDKEMYYVHSGPIFVFNTNNSGTVIERIRTTLPATFTSPLPTSTPSPETTHKVGTSVKVVHHETTTVMTTRSEVENIYPDTAEARTWTDFTSTTTENTPSRRTTRGSGAIPETDNVRTTTQDGFFIEREKNFEEELSNILRGFVPELSASTRVTNNVFVISITISILYVIHMMNTVNL